MKMWGRKCSASRPHTHYNIDRRAKPILTRSRLAVTDLAMTAEPCRSAPKLNKTCGCKPGPPRLNATGRAPPCLVLTA
jgi:hypothetical protein